MIDIEKGMAFLLALLTTKAGHDFWRSRSGNKRLSKEDVRDAMKDVLDPHMDVLKDIRDSLRDHTKELAHIAAKLE